MMSHDFAGQTFIRDLSLEQLRAMVRRAAKFRACFSDLAALQVEDPATSFCYVRKEKFDPATYAQIYHSHVVLGASSSFFSPCFALGGEPPLTLWQAGCRSCSPTV